MEKKQKYILGSFALLMIAYWFMFYIIDYGLMSIPYPIQELYGIGVVAILIVMLILALAFFKGPNVVAKKKTVAFILSTMVIVHLVSFVYLINGQTWAGTIAITDKRLSEQKYYFYIENVEDSEGLLKIECSKEVFDNLIIDADVLYTMEIKNNCLNKDRVKLQSIDSTGYIDNRRWI